MHPRAFHQFARAARSGLPAALFRLGRCYLLGLGVPSCPDAALRWLTRAAEAENLEAQALLATLALQGISHRTQVGLLEAASRYAGRPPDFEEALKWGTPAAAGGSAEAQALLGYILTSGPEEMRDMARAGAYYKLAAESGLAQGQLGWALALLRDDASKGGSAEVQRLLVAAAAADLPAAHFALGAFAEQASTGADHLATAGHLAIAAGHYRDAAERGHRSAQLRFGLALMNGRGVEQDTQAGETWLRRAGLAGDPLAAAMVGDLYARVGSEPPNFCEAGQWFQRAAEAGHIGAARALGQLSLRGGGFGIDPVTATHWLRVAATAGDMPAAYELGICLAHGIGTPCDETEALEWFHRAIDAMPAARFWCGRMLMEGRGGPVDLPAARACFLRAAADGNWDAVVVVAEMLVNGRGGPPDRPTAMRMFDRAAAQGHKGAQYALAVLQPACAPPPSETPASDSAPSAAPPPGLPPPGFPPSGLAPTGTAPPVITVSRGERVPA